MPGFPTGPGARATFPAWQQSALAEVNIGQFAGEAAARIYGLRQVPTSELDYLVIGSTIPWHWKFWTAPLVASCMGRRVPGFHVEQACATGLQAVIHAGAEVQTGKDVVGVSDLRSHQRLAGGCLPGAPLNERTQALADVWDNFGFDPATGQAMLRHAGNAARKHRIDRREVDEIALYRHQQYFDTLESGFLDRILVPLDVLDNSGKKLGRVDSDVGIRKLTASGLAAMRQLDTGVSGGTQTHASDGMATLLVTSPEKARELSPRPEIEISLLAKPRLASIRPTCPRRPRWRRRSCLRAPA